MTTYIRPMSDAGPFGTTLPDRAGRSRHIGRATAETGRTPSEAIKS